MTEAGRVEGWYYLHTNGDLIYKHGLPETDDLTSPFVRRVWPVNKGSRVCAWVIAIEALALGARESRVKSMAESWGLDNEDALRFTAHFVGPEGPLMEVAEGEDGQWGAAFTQAKYRDKMGFGEDALSAMADLVKPGITRVTDRGEKLATTGKL